MLDLEKIEKELAKSPAFFLRYEEWEAYKKGVQDTIKLIKKELSNA